MKKTFDICRETVDVSQMERINQELEQLLDALYEKQVPGDTFTLEELSVFCNSLITQQWDGSLAELEGAWCLQANPYQPRMPIDAQIDFIHRTTYLAVSTLTYVARTYPEVADAIEGYQEALQKGMRFAAKTKLVGHTYEEAYWLERFIGYFEKGGVIAYLVTKPGFCPQLYTLLSSIHQELGVLLQEQMYYDGFGNNQEERIKAISQKLVLL